MTMTSKFFSGIVKYLNDFFVNNVEEKDKLCKNFDFNDSQNLRSALENKVPDLRKKVSTKTKNIRIEDVNSANASGFSEKKLRGLHERRR